MDLKTLAYTTYSNNFQLPDVIYLVRVFLLLYLETIIHNYVSSVSNIYEILNDYT